MSLTEKLIKAYKLSSPISYSESNGAEALAWANKILRQLESGSGKNSSYPAQTLPASADVSPAIGTVEFKAAPMSGAAVKKKNCKKGHACKGTCISKNRECRNPLEGDAVKAADYLDEKVPDTATKTKAAPKKSTTKAKKERTTDVPENKPQKQEFGVNQFDTKTDKDLTTWLKESAAVRTKGDTAALRDNLGIIFEIQEKAKKDTYLGIKDAKGNLQAASIISNEKDHIYLDYLATAPWNLSTKKHKKAVKGAGTAAMEAVIAESINKGHKGVVRLEALPGAVAFYEKIGFVEVESRGGFNPGVLSMELSAAAAAAFLKKRGKL